MAEKMCQWLSGRPVGIVRQSYLPISFQATMLTTLSQGGQRLLRHGPLIAVVVKLATSMIKFLFVGAFIKPVAGIRQQTQISTRATSKQGISAPLITTLNISVLLGSGQICSAIRN